MPEKAGVKVSMNTAADVIHYGALIRNCGWLTCMEITIFIAEVTTVFVNKMNWTHGPLDCVSWLLCLSRRYKVFQVDLRFRLPFHINCIDDLSL